ncbi:hypothetical protein AVEN_264391-1 [Araneus ventricosus]|uniref:Reverse transcriptase domain-containing protein n=1 Tax=Araneus ventricosus TaxID=182803 RepID=A0A4Y2H7F2_ARAVE|nr:hypothetical protein AVEN_264391-1 [Araneus ventricosus]
MTIVNKCLEFNTFPSTLKIGIVLLFYKEGKNTTDPKSYRPITLLTTIGKLIEKLMTQRLEYHLKTMQQHHNKQYGFREGRSIDHALDNLLETIETHKRRKQHIAVVSIDIQGAFDNVTYASIRKRLRETSCPDNIRELLNSLLTNRIVIQTNGGMAHKHQTKGLDNNVT